MSYDSERSGIGAVVAIAVALIVVVVGCLLLAGAGLFWFRNTAMRQQEALMAREQALVQQTRLEAQAEAEAQKVADKIQIEPTLPAASGLTIVVDADGHLQLNGVATDLEQLRADLNEQVQDTDTISVIVLPVAECKIEDVTKVLSLCMELGVMDIQIRRSP